MEKGQQKLNSTWWLLASPIVEGWVFFFPNDFFSHEPLTYWLFNAGIQNNGLWNNPPHNWVFHHLKNPLLTYSKSSKRWSTWTTLKALLEVHLGVSKNNGTPKSSILIGFSIIKTIHFGYPYFWKHPFLFSRTVEREWFPTFPFQSFGRGSRLEYIFLSKVCFPTFFWGILTKDHENDRENSVNNLELGHFFWREPSEMCKLLPISGTCTKMLPLG